TDDGAAAHLKGMTMPPVSLRATDDTVVDLSRLEGRTVVFGYPRTGEPGKVALVEDWDMIPGARGCTPQTCAFRDLFADLK
ncbi:peroxiredoxin, partial [Acinetobacter baumannii]